MAEGPRVPRDSPTSRERGVTTVNPFLRLHIKLQRTGAKLRQWSKSKIENVKLLLCAAKQLIGILDVVQEFRQFSLCLKYA